MENTEEDSTEGTFVLLLSDQNNQIINKTINYLPERALTETQVRNHNDSFKALPSLSLPDLSSYFLLLPSLWPCFSSASEDSSAFQQITIFGIKQPVSTVLLESPFSSPSLEVHCSPSAEEKQVEQ